MKRVGLYEIVWIVAFLLVRTAYAKENGYGVAIKAGTVGLGAEFIKSLTDDLDIRIGINSYRYATRSQLLGEGGSSSPIDHTDYDMAYDGQSTYVLIDIYMTPHGTFHEVIGYLFSNNKMLLDTPIGGAYDINGVTGYLKAGQYLKGEALFESGPYLGFGWGNATEHKGFGVTFEFGFVYHGMSQVTLKTNIPGVTTADLRNEEIDVSDAEGAFIHGWYLNVALGLSYGF